MCPGDISTSVIDGDLPMGCVVHHAQAPVREKTLGSNWEFSPDCARWESGVGKIT